MFRDREHGGRLLGQRLERYRTENPIVLGLPRGGVPVAFEVSRTFGTALDVLVVKKIGAPACPEYALGAVAEGGVLYLHRSALCEAGVTEREAEVLAAREAAAVARRARIYRGDRPLTALTNRTVIVIDDGVATGATARAAARAARKFRAARIILATPVIAAQAQPELSRDFDDVVSVEQRDPFTAVGLWYVHFDEVSDKEVIRYLRSASEWTSNRETGGDSDWESPTVGGPPFSSPPGIESVPLRLEGAALGHGELNADLVLPAGARGVVIMVDRCGSSRRGFRNRLVASALLQAGFAAMQYDLLTEDELDHETEMRLDVGKLADRLAGVVRSVSELPCVRGLRIGLLGSYTAAAVALAAAAQAPSLVAAVVSRSGRPDLVPVDTLAKVRASVLLIVGSRDAWGLERNQSVLPKLHAAECAVVVGAGHTFEEPGSFEAVGRLAAEWFTRHVGTTAHDPRPAA